MLNRLFSKSLIRENDAFLENVLTQRANAFKSLFHDEIIRVQFCLLNLKQVVQVFTAESINRNDFDTSIFFTNLN